VAPKIEYIDGHMILPAWTEMRPEDAYDAAPQSVRFDVEHAYASAKRKIAARGLLAVLSDREVEALIECGAKA